MVDMPAKTAGLAGLHEMVAPILATEGPSWLQDVRNQAIRTFREFGIPTPSDEEFRFFSLRELETRPLAPAYGATVDRARLAKTTLGAVDALTLTFLNGEFAPELSSQEVLPEGVYVGPLADAWAFDPDAMERLTKVATLQGKLGTTNDERFVALNTAFLSDAAVVLLADGVALSRPIHLQFVTLAGHGDFAVFPRAFIGLGKNAEAKVIESHIGLGGSYFSCPVVEVELAQDAKLEHVRFVDETETSIHVANVYGAQGRQSVYTNTAVNFGGKIVRNDLNVWVGGEYAETWLNGANVATDRQVIDNHTRLDHAVPNCNSFEVYKSVLKDHGHGIFNGKIFVYEDAQKTDAKQTNQALLLSPNATMNTKPQLEIFADDVKCTHGATVGQLREDALFYLRARGIPKAEAEALLVYAFAAEVMEKITLGEVREALESALFERLK